MFSKWFRTRSQIQTFDLGNHSFKTLILFIYRGIQDPLTEFIRTNRTAIKTFNFIQFSFTFLFIDQASNAFARFGRFTLLLII